MSTTPSWNELLELVARLDAGGFENVAITYGDVSVRLSRSDVLADLDSPAARPAAASGPAPLPVAEAPSAPTSAPAPADSGPAAPDAPTIDSPMIGVFYRQSSPGSPPFIEAGQSVAADTVIGIIEIMKLMNPVVAGAAGVLREFLVRDGDAVEFGQPLAVLGAEGS